VPLAGPTVPLSRWFDVVTLGDEAPHAELAATDGSKPRTRMDPRLGNSTTDSGWGP